jgi:hypothetical protein
MGALEATQLAEVPPSPEVRAAAATGSTIAASTGVPPPRAPGPTRAQDNAAVEPLGQARLAFDYTHLGPQGADFFSAIVTRLLARAVPELRNELIP